MKNCFRFSFLILAGFGLSSVFAQAQTTSVDSMVLHPLACQVQRYYNQNQVDSLYALADESVRQKISLTTMKSQINQMRSGWGQWKSMNLEEVKDGIAHYTATFDKETSDFYLGRLGTDGRVGTMAFRPKQK